MEELPKRLLLKGPKARGSWGLTIERKGLKTRKPEDKALGMVI